jgi:non-specific serine/threonine protein kinase/serine/threonine-protein kinase
LIEDDSRATGLSEDDSPTLAYEPADGQESVRVRNYRILQRVGTGGMGEVYKAEQLEPIKREVALKVVKPGMDTREIVARFDSERQTLALMNHTNIARIFDGGATEQGRPYFAMEFVKGLSISRYCDTHNLRTSERLRLFVQVCEGVQHAHQKGIIHRDIKSSNVLVEVRDGKAVPKIIDFGVAKAIALSADGRTAFTPHGQLIGTPEYMSPEQAAMTGVDVDTRSDVYSLGILLYKLLVGTLPFDPKELRRGGYLEIQRRLRESEPPNPSTRLTKLAGEANEAAQRRSTDVVTLLREIRGELDWIVMKALEKDRERRYGSAAALAADVERYLENRPVHASPPNPLYRLRKFVRRHRAGVATAVLVFVSLILGVIGTTTNMIRALRAERVASEEAETARQVSDFLVDLFQVADPAEAQGDSITVRQVLDVGAEKIERDLGDQPLTQARLMHTIGSVYRQLGLYEEAGQLLENSLEIREKSISGDALEVAASLVSLSDLERSEGNYAEAERLAVRAVSIREETLGSENPELAEALRVLGSALMRQGKSDEARPTLERAVEIYQRVLGPSHPDLAQSQAVLAGVYWERGEYDTAEPLFLKALETFEQTLGPSDYRVRTTLNDLAALYWSQGKLERATALYQRALEIKVRVLGSDHPTVAGTLNNLALVFDAQDRLSEAEPLLVRGISILEGSLGEDHDTTAMLVANLAWIYYRQGRMAEAEPLYDQALAVYNTKLGANHSRVAILLGDQAKMFADQGKADRAIGNLQRAAAIWESNFNPDHPRVAECLHSLAGIYSDQGRLEEAETSYRRALEIRLDKLGPEHPAVEETRSKFVELLRHLGRSDEADRL